VENNYSFLIDIIAKERKYFSYYKKCSFKGNILLKNHWQW